MANASFRISMSNSARWDNEAREDVRVVHLEVRDDLSGVLLADIEFSARQFMSLLAGGTLWPIEGTQSSDLDRVGKKMVNQSIPVPKEIESDLPKSDRTLRDHDAPAKAYLVKWSKEQDFAADWDVFEPIHHNFGWTVTVRRWR